MCTINYRWKEKQDLKMWHQVKITIKSPKRNTCWLDIWTNERFLWSFSTSNFLGVKLKSFKPIMKAIGCFQSNFQMKNPLASKMFGLFKCGNTGTWSKRSNKATGCVLVWIGWGYCIIWAPLSQWCIGSIPSHLNNKRFCQLQNVCHIPLKITNKIFNTLRM